MKQHITKDQHNDLGLEPMIKLEEWCLSKAYEPLELSIGQMIEFLYEHQKTDWSILFGKELAFVVYPCFGEIRGLTPKNRKGELCDGLWEAVKEVLEKS